MLMQKMQEHGFLRSRFIQVFVLNLKSATYRV